MTPYGSDSKNSIDEFKYQWPLIKKLFYPKATLVADIEYRAKEGEVLAKLIDVMGGSDKMLGEENYIFGLGARFQWPEPKGIFFYSNGIYKPQYCSVTIGHGRERTGYNETIAEYYKKLTAIQHGGQYPRDTLQCYMYGFKGELIYAILVDTKEMFLFLEFNAKKGNNYSEVKNNNADYWETHRTKDKELNRFKVMLNTKAKERRFLIKEYKNPKYFDPYYNQGKLWGKEN